MTVETIDYATGEVIELTEAEARRLTERIRSALDRVSTAWADLAERITEAYQRRADLALGYTSWAEYADAELRPAEGLAVEVRRQLVSMLSAAGMSTRAIAPTVGVTHPTVIADQRSGGKALTTSPEPYPQARRAPWPERRDDPEPERIDRLTGEVVPAPTFKPLDVTDWTPEELDDQIAADDAVIESYERATVPAPVKVVGLDGKTYTRPEPKETTKETTKASGPRRRPLVDAADDAGWELTKAVEKLGRIVADDRYHRHEEEVATRLRSHLVKSIQVCRDLLDRLPDPNPTKEN